MRKLTIFIALVAIPILALAYSTGPPNGYTGAPGERTCVDCHSSFPILFISIDCHKLTFGAKL